MFYINFEKRNFSKNALWISLAFLTLLSTDPCVCSQPKFAQPLKNVSIAVGRDASFTCVVTHLGGYRVGWVKADTKAIQAIHTHVITHNGRVTVTHSGKNTWYLHIKDVQEEDRGPYMCQINTDPMKSQIGYLEVTVPPEIIDDESSSDIMVPEGSSAVLVCRAKGYPKPLVVWRREDNKPIMQRTNNSAKPRIKKLTYEGEFLNLTQITRSDMGPYLCIANNSVPPIVSKRMMVDVHFAPVVHVPDQLIGAPIGKTVILKCNVESSPKSIQFWTKDDGKTSTGTMLITDTDYDISENLTNYYINHMTLTINNFQHRYEGRYYCNAKNSIGEVSGHITVNAIDLETEPPVTYDESSYDKWDSNNKFSNNDDDTNEKANLNKETPYEHDLWSGNRNPSSSDHREMDPKHISPYTPKIPPRPTKNTKWTWDTGMPGNAIRVSFFDSILTIFMLIAHLDWLDLVRMFIMYGCLIE